MPDFVIVIFTVMGLMSFQEDDQLVQTISDRAVNIHQLFIGIKEKNLLWQAHFIPQVKKNCAAANKRLNISVEILGKVSFKLCKKLVLASSPFDKRFGVPCYSRQWFGSSHRRYLPPLISIVAPVIKAAIGLATKTMQRAISSGVAKRCTNSLVSA